MGAVYRRSGGGSVCVDAVTAAAVVGAALVVQFLFYAAVTVACPNDVSYLTGLGSIRNITYFINVDNSNLVDVAMETGDQTLMQTQTQMQDITQDQSQTQSPVQSANQAVTAPQMQEQTQRQFQRQDDTVIMNAADGGRLRQEEPGVEGCEDPMACVYPALEDYPDYTDYPDYPLPPAPGETTGAGETAQEAEPSARRRRRRWALPPLGLSILDLSNLPLSNLGLSGISHSLCPALSLYLGR